MTETICGNLRCSEEFLAGPRSNYYRYCSPPPGGDQKLSGSLPKLNRAGICFQKYHRVGTTAENISTQVEYKYLKVVQSITGYSKKSY